MSTRLKKGRRVPDPRTGGKQHGRLALVAASPLPAPDLRELARNYAAGCIGRELARRVEPGRSKSTPYRTHNRLTERISSVLSQQPGGLDVLRRVNDALASRAVRSTIGLAARAHVDNRAFILEAAANLADLIVEQGITSTAGLLVAGGLAAKSASASVLFAAALEQSPKVLGATRTTPADGKGDAKGKGHTSMRLGAHGDLLALAMRASDSARNDVLTLPDIEARHRQQSGAGGRGPSAEDEARMRQVLEERARREAEGRQVLDAQGEAADAPEGSLAPAMDLDAEEPAEPWPEEVAEPPAPRPARSRLRLVPEEQRAARVGMLERLVKTREAALARAVESGVEVHITELRAALATARTHLAQAREGT